MKTLESACGVAAVTRLPREAWEKEAEELGGDTACMVTALPRLTVTSLFTWTMGCHLLLCPSTGHPAAQIQSTGAPAGVSEAVKTAGTLKEGEAATAGAAPHAPSAEITD